MAIKIEVSLFMEQYQSDIFHGVLDFNIPVYPHVTYAFLASGFWK